MFNFLRNKTITTLAVLVCLGMLIGFAQNRGLETGKSFFVQDAISSILAPIESAAHAVFGVGGWLKRVLRPTSSILKENARLREQVRSLQMDNARLREAAFENLSLRKALGLKQISPLKMTAAEVISHSESSWFDTATLNCGSRKGVEKGSAVFNHLGLIGQIVDIDPFTAQMVSLTDLDSAVGGTVQRSRCSGIVRGQGSEYLVLTYLPKDADVIANDIVVSSGMGKVIPKGLPIGRVVRVIRDTGGVTTSALIAPSVRFEQVETVFIAGIGQSAAQ
ncbi:MAG: rod shape-determining protein MreC [Armatimonadetes bacterium]|nr:rod shape-determining protein MreC [Armatimonadota bacterium]